MTSLVITKMETPEVSDSATAEAAEAAANTAAALASEAALASAGVAIRAILGDDGHAKEKVYCTENESGVCLWDNPEHLSRDKCTVTKTLMFKKWRLLKIGVVADAPWDADITWSFRGRSTTWVKHGTAMEVVYRGVRTKARMAHLDTDSEYKIHCMKACILESLAFSPRNWWVSKCVHRTRNTPFHVVHLVLSDGTVVFFPGRANVKALLKIRMNIVDIWNGVSGRDFTDAEHTSKLAFTRYVRTHERVPVLARGGRHRSIVIPLVGDLELEIIGRETVWFRRHMVRAYRENFGWSRAPVITTINLAPKPKYVPPVKQFVFKLPHNFDPSRIGVQARGFGNAEHLPVTKDPVKPKRRTKRPARRTLAGNDNDDVDLLLCHGENSSFTPDELKTLARRRAQAAARAAGRKRKKNKTDSGKRKRDTEIPQAGSFAASVASIAASAAMAFATPAKQTKPAN